MKGPFNNIDDGMSQDDSEHIGDFSSPRPHNQTLRKMVR